MNKIFTASIITSIIIHASFIGVGAFSGHKLAARMAPPALLKNKAQDVSFEFVEIPDAVPESKEVNKNSKVISDKTVKAKDTVKGEAQEHKARAKEVYKSKQIAKMSQPSVQTPPQPVVQPVTPPKPQETTGPQKIEEETVMPKSIPAPEPQRIKYDIVNLPEVSESIFSAPDDGPLTFETQAHKIGPYFKEVKKRIEKYWLSYLLFKYQNSAPQESEVAVKFKILPTGEVTGVTILEYSGDVLFRDFSVASITNTAPFPPLPENLKEEVKKEGGLDIVFTFRYR